MGRVNHVGTICQRSLIRARSACWAVTARGNDTALEVPIGTDSFAAFPCADSCSFGSARWEEAPLSMASWSRRERVDAAELAWIVMTPPPNAGRAAKDDLGERAVPPRF